MAPRTRSGKGLTIEEVAAHKRALLAGPVNTTGLPGLPTELLLEIVAHLPKIEFPCHATRPFDNTYLLRGQFIRALSQMCKSLRSVFLPLAYERIEVCALQSLSRQTASQRSRVSPFYRGRPVKNNAHDKIMATELVRQLEVVTIRDASLAQYVKIINVMFTSYSKETVIEEFFRCLPLFPNVHTIQFLRSSASPIDFQKFQLPQRQFPSVQKVFVGYHATYEIIKLFPNVKHIATTGGTAQDFLLKLHASDLDQSCLNVEDLRGLEMIDNENLWNRHEFFSTAINKLPKLRVVRFGICGFGGSELRVDQVKSAARVQHLRSIIFQVKSILKSTPPATSTSPQYRYKGAIISSHLKKQAIIELLVTAVRILQAKHEDPGCVRYLSVLSLEGDTLLRLQVNKGGCVCEVDREGLFTLMKENRGELTLAD